MARNKKKYRTNDNKDVGSRYRNERFVFIMCVFIATSFWLLIKLSEIYNVNYELKVHYDNPPSELRLTEIADTTLTLNFTARGFAILKMNLFEDMDNLDIDLNNYSIEENGKDKYSIYTSELSTNLAQMTGVDENKISFSKPVLFFKMEKTGEKVVPLLPDYQLNFAEQFELYSEVKVTPNTVKIYGPQSVLDTIQNLKTNKIVLNNVNSDVVEKVSISNPKPDLITIGPNDVSIFFKVAKFTESHISVKVNVNKLKYSIQTFPLQVEVYYKIAQKDFKKVRSHQFDIQPVVGDFDIVYAKKLPLKIVQQPDFVRNVRIIPAEVEFLIIK